MAKSDGVLQVEHVDGLVAVFDDVQQILRLVVVGRNVDRLLPNRRFVASLPPIFLALSILTSLELMQYLFDERFQLKPRQELIDILDDEGRSQDLVLHSGIDLATLLEQLSNLIQIEFQLSSVAAQFYFFAFLVEEVDLHVAGGDVDDKDYEDQQDEQRVLVLDADVGQY